MNDRSTRTGSVASSPRGFEAVSPEPSFAPEYGPVEKAVGAVVCCGVFAPVIGLAAGVWGHVTARLFEFGWGLS